MLRQSRYLFVYILFPTVGIFGLLIAYTPPLSFWWDEFSLIQAHQKPFHGITDSHMGHFFPLGRLAFAFYVETFGSSYFPMILINAFICLVALILIFFSIQTATLKKAPLRPIFLIPVATLMGSVGFLYDIQWAMQIAWFLSIFFGATAICSLHLLRFRNLFLAISILLSWLSLSGNIVAVAIFVSAIGVWKKKLSTKHVFFTITGGFCLFLAGYILAKNAHPIDPNAYGYPVNFTNVFNNPMKVIELTCVIAVSWLLSPISVSSVSSQSGFLSLGSEVGSIPNLFLVVLLFVLFPLVFWSLKSHLKHKPISMLLILLGIFIQAGFTVVARFVFYGQEESIQIQGLLHVRYAPVMQLLATLFWTFLFLACLSTRARLLTSICTYSIASLLLATLGLVLLSLPKSIANSSYIGRISYTTAQLDEFKKCVVPSEVTIFPDIQPSISSYTMCEITSTVSGLND